MILLTSFHRIYRNTLEDIPFEEDENLEESKQRGERLAKNAWRQREGDTPRVKCQTQRDKDLRSVPPPPSPSYEVVESSRVDSLPGRGIAGYVEDAHRLPDALLCRETMVAVARPSRCREIVGTLRTGNIASSYSRLVMEYNRNMAGRVRNTTIRVDSISDARETKRKRMFRENVSSLEMKRNKREKVSLGKPFRYWIEATQFRSSCWESSIAHARKFQGFCKEKEKDWLKR